MSSFPRHRLASGQTAMDWIDDWEEPDADVAYEPAAYVNRHVRREPAAIAMTTQVTTKVPHLMMERLHGFPMRMP